MSLGTYGGLVPAGFEVRPFFVSSGELIALGMDFIKAVAFTAAIFDSSKLSCWSGSCLGVFVPLTSSVGAVGSLVILFLRLLVAVVRCRFVAEEFFSSVFFLALRLFEIEELGAGSC